MTHLVENFSTKQGTGCMLLPLAASGSMARGRVWLEDLPAPTTCGLGHLAVAAGSQTQTGGV